ncbi:hypothetical protein Tco_0473059 [Tanacetum coccineum]
MSRNECNDKITSGDDTDTRHSYDIEPMVEVPYTAEYNAFAVETQHSKQPKNMNDTSLMEKVDSNTTLDSSDMCNNEFKDDQNADDHEDEHVVLADLIANLKCDIDEHLPYVQSLEKEIDELEPDKADFSNIYDLFLQEYVLNDVMCSYLHSLSDLDAHTELKCLYHHKIKECKCLAEKLSKQIESFEQMKNDIVCKQKGSTVFLKEREQYFKIQDLKAQLQEKNIAISELKKLIENMKGKSVDTNFEKQSILGKPPFQPIRNQLVKKDAHSHKTTKRYRPVEKKNDSKKHDRQIPIGQKFSPNKSSAVYLKTTPPRSGLTWKPTGRIFTYVGLRWIPIRKFVETCYNTNDSAPPLGKKTHNPNTTICANSSSLSACTSKASNLISS